MAQSQAQAIHRLHRNAQRLLRPLTVVNPYAESFTFLDDRTRTRRDHAKYLTLIETIALLHQHQRALRTARSGGKAVEYIEVTLDDIALANELAHEVLGRSLDELPPRTRRVLKVIETMVEEQCRELDRPGGCTLYPPGAPGSLWNERHRPSESTRASHRDGVRALRCRPQRSALRV